MWVDCLVIVLAIFIPYHQVSGHRFVEFDDGLYTFQNLYIINGLTWDGVVWAFTNMDAANWHPLTWLSHFVDREVWGAYPGGYMLVNVAWHMLASCVCYAAFRRVTRDRFIAFSVAIFFALHPVNVENVAWASERKSLLDAFFWFLGIIAYIDFIEGRGRRFYGILVITHLLGLMSKAMHVTFPCSLVLIHLLYAGARGHTCMSVFWRSVRLALPLLFISIYFCALTTVAQTVAMMDLSSYPISLRLLNVVASYARYLEMFFLPRDFAPFYPLFVTELTIKAVVWPFLVLSAISLMALLLVKSRPALLIGWFWFLGTMVPVIGLVQVGSQSHADRYMYIPMIGLALWVPSLLGVLSGPISRGLKCAWLGICGASLMAATWVQVSYWRDGVTLFQHSASVTGDCMTAVLCTAGSYCRNERPHDAIVYLDSKIAIAQNPFNRARLKGVKASALLQLSDYKRAFEVGGEAIAEGDQELMTIWVVANSAYQLGLLADAEKYINIARSMPAPKWAPSSVLLTVQLQSGLDTLSRAIAEKRLAQSSF